MDKILTMMEEVTNAFGVSGMEGEVQQVTKKYMEPYADEILYDRIGSIVGKLTGKAGGPRVLMAGHIDEIGLMITKVRDDGFLQFVGVGGWYDQVLLDQRVLVMTRDGEKIPGLIVSGRPPHMIKGEARTKLIPKEKMVIDVGAFSPEEVESFGIQVGDLVVPDGYFFRMKNPDLLCARAWDDRVGVCMMLEVLRRLSETRSNPNEFYAAGTVLEEIGLRGAKTCAELVDPDCAIVLETGLAEDTPPFESWERLEKLGGGPTILLKDGMSQYSYKFKELVRTVAEENNIPYQFGLMLGGGTDAGEIMGHGCGVPTVCINVPVRYVHSPFGIIHRKDFDAAVDLLVALVNRLDEETVNNLV